ARTCIHICFIVIDITIPHNFLYLGLRNVTALHPAPGVLSIFDIGSAAVKSMVAVYIRSGIFLSVIRGYMRLFIGSLAPLYKKEGDPEHGNQQVGIPFTIHW